MAKGKVRRLARKATVLTFLLEVAIYALLVTGYFLVVIHFLSETLQHLYQANQITYAVVALTLICGQGVLLEIVTRTLVGLFQRRWDRD